MDAARLIRDSRNARGLTQAQLARRAGTTQTYISRLERGVVSPSVATLERLLHAMGQRLVLGTAFLSAGNVSARDLRADLHDLSPEDRLSQAMELSAFLTDAASQGRHRGTLQHGSG